MASGKITMTLLVRNEQDIIADTIRYHQALGVDSFIVMDNLSSDATPDILRDLSTEIDIELLYQPEDIYDQRAWVTEMARKAATDHGADWVINSDADEFWTPRDGDLKSTLASVPEQVGVLFVPRRNAVVIAEDGARGNGRSHPGRSDIFERDSRNSLGKPLPDKILHRASATVSVIQGNHKIGGVPGETREAGDVIEIFHYPYRTIERYKEKIRLGGAAYARNTALPELSGATWRKHFEELETGGVDAFWTEVTNSTGDAALGIQEGRYFRDGRVMRALAALPRSADAERMLSAGNRLLIRTRNLVDCTIDHHKKHIRDLEATGGGDHPARHNFEFTTNGARTHLRAVEGIAQRADASALCADLGALRDVFSLFPRNLHFRRFLGDVLKLTCAADAARLREDCDGKHVILHTSCLPRLSETEASVASFGDASEGHKHIVLIGDKETRPEQDLPLSLDYDGHVLRVPAPDTYEGLHRKLFYAYMLLDLIAKPRLVVKLDDNMLLQDRERFERCLDDIAAQGAEIAGRRVGSASHHAQWHGWHISKCADPVVDGRGYQYPLPRHYPGGGYGYVLGPKGLAACCYMYLAMKEFFAMRVVGLEDAFVGHAAYAQGLDIVNVADPATLFALPGLTTRERMNRLVEE